jgi:hypothetical protein
MWTLRKKSRKAIGKNLLRKETETMFSLSLRIAWKKVAALMAVLFVCSMIANAGVPGDRTPAVDKRFDAPPRQPESQPTPVPQTVIHTTTTEAKPPLQHTEPVRPDAVEIGPSTPGATPTPENPDVKDARERAVKSYYAAVEKSNEALLAEYEHNKWALTNREAVLVFQQRAGKVIFAVVLLLVFVGVVFSGVQFFRGLRPSRKGRRAEADAATTIEASWKGIKMTSSILGVIILMISFLFFYAYLVSVFNITVISE